MLFRCYSPRSFLAIRSSMNNIVTDERRCNPFFLKESVRLPGRCLKKVGEALTSLKVISNHARLTHLSQQEPLAKGRAVIG
jgi:hypothetical protein